MNISATSYSPNVYPPSTAARPAVAGAAPASGKAAEKAAQTTSPSPEELAQLSKLQARDREVRQHEQAHLAAAGGLATSGASFTYQKGPDGVSYAIGGEVGIDTSPGRTPEETISRARTIRAAALAPADPSGQDLAVAAQASQMEGEARAEIASQSRAESTGDPTARQTQSEPQRDAMRAARGDPFALYYAAAASERANQAGTSLSVYA